MENNFQIIAINMCKMLRNRSIETMVPRLAGVLNKPIFMCKPSTKPWERSFRRVLLRSSSHRGILLLFSADRKLLPRLQVHGVC